MPPEQKTRLVEPPDGVDLAGLAVDVDIARSQNAGTILLRPAFDPDGTRMRTFQGQS